MLSLNSHPQRALDAPPTGLGRRLGALGLALGLLALAGLAQAGEAARIVFVSGPVHSGARALAVGDAVQEGDEIATGVQGYVYLKTVDNGLLILRPDSRARVVDYHVDRVNPANTRVKFELLSGVARSVSGDAVKLARQNFRFNTPVAAIGVRGTDFTVSTDQETSRVTVISGAIVVSGFSATCMPGGGGPCDRGSSRELAATQVGQMLQVRRGQAVPQLMSSSPLAPDTVAPPRPDEPVGKAGGSVTPSADISLDPQKGDNLLQQAEQVKVAANAAPPPVIVAPPGEIVVAPAAPVTPVAPVVPVVPVTPVPPVVPVTPVAPASTIAWGRWQPVLDQQANIDTVALLQGGAKEVARNGYYAVFRTPGTNFQSPAQGTMGFALNQGEALLTDKVSGSSAAATMQNGKLQVDFGTSKFSTSFDLLSGTEKFKLSAVGVVTADGVLSGTPFYPSTMTVNGVLSTEHGGAASYIFTSRIDDRRVANGITYWLKN